MACFILKSKTTREDLEEMLFCLREKHSDQFRNSIGRFKTDGSRLATKDLADVLNDEVMSNKVLSYDDYYSKLDFIGAK